VKMLVLQAIAGAAAHPAFTSSGLQVVEFRNEKIRSGMRANAASNPQYAGCIRGLA
jgi:hypothetical protein